MGKDSVFMDDNARPHRARIVDTCLRQHHVTRMDWPACSPDLNPIEHVWDQLGRAVRQRLNINSTLVDLRRYMLEEWDRIVCPWTNLNNWYTACGDDVMPALLQPVELHVTELYQCWIKMIKNHTWLIYHWITIGAKVPFLDLTPPLPLPASKPLHNH